MSRLSREQKRKAKKQAKQQGFESAIEAMYERGKRLSVLKADADFERKQAQVGLASNILGLTAGGAATVAAAKNPALRKPKTADAGPATGKILNAAEKGKLGGKLKRVLKTPKGRAGLVAAGAGGALGLQVANVGGDVVANRVLARESGVGKSVEQSYISKSDEVVVTGNGQSLVEKRNFDAEADRQRRLGLYAGTGLLGAGAAGAAALKDVEFKGKDAKNPRQVLRVSRKPNAKAKYFKTRTGALAGLAALSGGAGLAAYKRGISERNYPYV